MIPILSNDMAKPKSKKTPLFEKLSGLNTLGKNADIIESSKFFVDEFHDTKIPALNIALSARVNGGFSRGSTLIAGDSKTFKTMFMMVMVKSFLDANPDAFAVFYDVEFGTNADNLKSLGIDISRVYHKPLSNIEDLKIDISKLLNGIDEDDNIIICIDSLGAIASKKEEDDAEKGDIKVDMSRAKALKSFWRIANPLLNVKNVPLVAIGQTYGTQETYSKTVINGGKGMVYFPNNIWTVSKVVNKDKATKEVLSNFFKITVTKGRLTKEGSVFPIEVTHESGIDRYSSLLDIALSLGYVVKPKNGWFTHEHMSKNYRRAETSCDEFWKPILHNKKFREDVKSLFSLGSLNIPETTDITVFDDDELETVTD